MSDSGPGDDVTQPPTQVPVLVLWQAQGYEPAEGPAERSSQAFDEAHGALIRGVIELAGDHDQSSNTLRSAMSGRHGDRTQARVASEHTPVDVQSIEKVLDEADLLVEGHTRGWDVGIARSEMVVGDRAAPVISLLAPGHQSRSTQRMLGVIWTPPNSATVRGSRGREKRSLDSRAAARRRIERWRRERGLLLWCSMKRRS
jgi:hypothetical protein